MRKRALVLRLGGILIAAAMVLAAGTRPTGPVAGQGFGANGIVSVYCGDVGNGRNLCRFRSEPIAPTPSEPGSITIGLSSTPGVNIIAAYGADPAGDICDITDGAGTNAVRLACPDGLTAPATVTMALAPRGVTIQGVVVYGGLAAEAGGSGGERWVFTIPGRPPLAPNLPGAPLPAVARPVSSLPTYPSGWNLTGGGSGWNLCRAFDDPGAIGYRWVPGPFYTSQVGGSGYETIQGDAPLAAGVGVWAYFPEPIVMRGWSCLGILDPLSTPLPAGQWVMIADTGDAPQALSGVDAAYTYDPSTGLYSDATVLEPGQGAWVYSAAGGVVTLTSLCPGRPCSPAIAP